MPSDRDVEEFTGAVMALVEVIRRGQSRAFNTEHVAVMQLLAARGPRRTRAARVSWADLPASSLLGDDDDVMAQRHRFSTL